MHSHDSLWLYRPTLATLGSLDDPDNKWGSIVNPFSAYIVSSTVCNYTKTLFPNMVHPLYSLF